MKREHPLLLADHFLIHKKNTHKLQKYQYKQIISVPYLQLSNGQNQIVNNCSLQNLIYANHQNQNKENEGDMLVQQEIDIYKGYWKNELSYNIMFELFADCEEANQHLEEYQYYCWLRERAQFSERLRVEALNCTSYQNRCIQQASTLQFEPLQIQSSEAIAQTQDFQLYLENQTTAPTFSLDGEQMQQISATNGNQFNNEWRPLDDTLNQGTQKQTTVCGNEGKTSSSFNTVDYIIKHCFKKMLSLEFREQVEPICEEYNLTYPQFCLYWKNKTEKYLPNKHIGLTRFKKMIDETKSKAVLACRQFLTLYLWHEYPRYVAIGQMRNKQEYLRCATKLMYISSLSKRGDISQGARKQ